MSMGVEVEINVALRIVILHRPHLASREPLQSDGHASLVRHFLHRGRHTCTGGSRWYRREHLPFLLHYLLPQRRAALSCRVKASCTIRYVAHFDAARRAIVLWVDDVPQNNDHERESLSALGISLFLANDTEEALERLQREHLRNHFGHDSSIRARRRLGFHGACHEVWGHRPNHLLHHVSGESASDKSGGGRCLRLHQSAAELFSLVLAAIQIPQPNASFRLLSDTILTTKI
jgi:CheY-like chemotaxis protein